VLRDDSVDFVPILKAADMLFGVKPAQKVETAFPQDVIVDDDELLVIFPS